MDFGRHNALKSHRQASEAGTIELWEAVPHLYVTRAVGRMESAHADAWIAMADRILERGPRIAGIFDWLGMEAYDSDVRKRLTEWGVRHRKELVEVHIAHSSALVRMGVSVANIALGGMIEPHATRVTLLAKYNALIEKLGQGDAPGARGAAGSERR